VGSSGLVVSERTADGRFDLSYLHLSSAAVRRGDKVGEGAALGAVGVTGRRSAEAPHLHFGVREAGGRTAYRDPLDFLAPPAAPNRPQPAPAPAPVGQPAVADPAPVPASPVRTPVPASPAPTPGPVPASPERGPAPAPLLVPGLPHVVGVPSLAPSHGHAGARRQAVPGLLPHLLASTPSAWSGRHAAPDRGSAPRLRVPGSASVGPRSATVGPGGVPRASAAATPRHAHATSPHHGVNLGWLAACVGLIALATALGHPDGTKRAAGRSRAAAARKRAAIARSGARLGALLRPASRGGQAR
jgi:hypothetical protein